MKFEKGQKVVWPHNGEEIQATVLASGPGVEGPIYQIDVNGEKKHVNESELLSPKKPGFLIRDLAFVINENREAVQGEIVATGFGPNKRRFFQLQVTVGQGQIRNWYSEDEVFNISNPEKHTTARVTIL